MIVAFFVGLLTAVALLWFATWRWSVSESERDRWDGPVLEITVTYRINDREYRNAASLNEHIELPKGADELDVLREARRRVRELAVQVSREPPGEVVRKARSRPEGS